MPLSHQGHAEGGAVEEVRLVEVDDVHEVREVAVAHAIAALVSPLHNVMTHSPVLAVAGGDQLPILCSPSILLPITISTTTFFSCFFTCFLSSHFSSPSPSSSKRLPHGHDKIARAGRAVTQEEHAVGSALMKERERRTED